VFDIDPAKPLLLIDVDGVISLFGFDRADPPAGRFQLVDGIAHFLSETAGELLCRLATAFDPVWCTGWEDKANEYLPLALSLPGPFPVVALDRETRPAAAHWKLGAIDRYAGRSRALAWIDDAHDAACAAWATDRPGATLLLATDPAVGITEHHADELLAWAESVERAVPAGP
jgi:hypothetical protein